MKKVLSENTYHVKIELQYDDLFKKWILYFGFVKIYMSLCVSSKNFFRINRIAYFDKIVLKKAFFKYTFTNL